MENYLIYKFTSPSGKSYIGQTCDLKKRIKCHKSLNSKCRAFASAIKKHGYENFKLEILEEKLTLEEANILEELYIEQYNTLSPNGYNLQKGGLNHKCLEETKKLISEINKDLGKGTKRSVESKYKQGMSISGEKHWNFGKHRSEETLNKMSKSTIGEKSYAFGLVGELNPTSKKYIITFPDGHEETIIGMNQFCKLYGLNHGNMIQVAKGNYKQHKGFKCRYAD